MNTIEIELRYEVLEPSQLAPFLARLKRIQHKRDVDIYFDNQKAELYQKGIFIRIRNNKQLDFKFNRACLDNPHLPIQDYCEEHSFLLPLKEEDLAKLNQLLINLNLSPSLQANIESLKSANSFIEHYTVDKIRTSYLHSSFIVAIDEVFDLGIFLEIELMADSTNNIEAIKNTMQQSLSNLTLRPLRTGYGTLLLRKKDFQHYLLGRFILEEDKNHQQELNKKNYTMLS